MRRFPRLPADRLASFLDAIHVERFSHEPRLVFADWLEDQGDPRAELIRIQCAASEAQRWHRPVAGLSEREKTWFQRYGRVWPGEPGRGVRILWRDGLPLIWCNALHTLKSLPNSLHHALTEGWANLSVSVRTMKKLSPELDGYLTDLAGVRSLDMDGKGAGLVATHPALMSRVVGLQLHSSSLAETQVNEGDNWRSLRRLDLQFCALTDDALRRLRSLPRLEELALRQLPIRGTGLVWLSDLPHLRRLTLVGQGFRVGEAEGAGQLDLRELPRLAALEHLDLDMVRMTQAQARSLAPLTRLRSLILQNNPLPDGGLVYLREMAELRRLDLRFTSITNAGLRHLTGLCKLESLQLWRTEVTEAGLKHLTGLTRLRELSLPGTITDAGLKMLRQFTHLEDLSMDETRITRAGLNHLKAMKNLRLLNPGSAATYLDSWLELEECMPGLEIVR